tara:strand:+ start:5 stop:451 length:447 start_codon:yes stop_codon:yes gene_type:complete
MRKRNKTSKQEKIRKNCQTEYEKYRSIKHASIVLRRYKRMAEKYYKKFERQESIETDVDFIQTQRSIRHKILFKMDCILAQLEEQFDRISKQLKKGDSMYMIRYEMLKTRILKLSADLWQQKARIEMTTTLNTPLGNYVEKKYGKRLR